MNRLQRLAGAILAIGGAMALGAAIALALRPEQRLLRQLRRAAALAEKHGPEGTLAAASRATALAEFFADEIDLALPPHFSGRVSRAELPALALQARGSVDELRIRIRDRRFEQKPDGQRAVLRLAVEVMVEARGYGANDVGELTLEWRQEHREWRIAAVSAAGALRPLPER